MKAIKIDPLEQTLSWTEFETPVVAANEVLLKVYATAVNRADLLQRQGKYPVPPGASPIPGLEAAGVIIETGAEVRGFSKGDRVCCLLAGGGYAEYVNVPSQHLMHIPENLSFEEAAAIPEAYLTAYLNLYIEGNLKKDEVVLIHAAASGVGCAAVQLAYALKSVVFATCGSDEKCDFVKSQGALKCVNYKSEDFLIHFGEKSVDVILDMVGQLHFQKNMRILGRRGRLIMLSLISGSRTEIDLSALLRQNLSIRGSTLRDRSTDEKALLIDAFKKNVLPLFISGELRPVVCQIFQMNSAQDAHAYVESGRNLGKVVLKVN